MKRLHILVAAIGLLALFALPAAAMHHEIKIFEKPGIGRYLTDTEGMALYFFKNDSVGESVCTGGCVNNWPLFYRPQIEPPDGLDASDFGTITRKDGAMQTTFRGFPLYYFKGDVAPGDTKGNDMMDVWYVIDPDDFPH
ncbi:MAG: hypothetical protein AB7D06_04080 [Pedobacter sp.]